MQYQSKYILHYILFKSGISEINSFNVALSAKCIFQYTDIPYSHCILYP